MKELAIHHYPTEVGKSARVRVNYRAESGAQAHERETEFKFTVTDEQRRLIQWYLEEYLIYPWGEFRTRAQQVEDLMERLGAELFEAVFSSRETQALYAHVSDDLNNTRVVIHAGSPEGIALPWECLRDPTRCEHRDLARLAHAFVRSHSEIIVQSPPALTDTGMFNVLMVICRPGGPEGDVPFQSVARPLLELFRPHRDHICIEVLRPPTFEQLARVLSKKPNFYHILHFDGHGSFPQGTGKFYEILGSVAQGRLVFEGEDGRARAVTGEELGSLLADKGVPVLLLNACQSGMTRPESLYPSVGNQLLKAGARGVVAMAYSVYVQSAVRFMARLYEELMNGEELARAVALAREELCAHPQRLSPIGEIELRDWVVPVLFESAPTRLTPKPVRELHLDVSLLQNQQAKAGAEVDCPEPPVFGFIGRDNVILELERALQKETIVLLEGMAGVGKTETALGFARWCAETGALSGPIFFNRFDHYLPLARICDRVGQVFNATVRQQLRTDWHLLDPRQRRQVALTILKQVPCLLVWDNFEPVVGFPTGTPSDWKPDEQKELRDFLSELRGGQTKVLITSRRNEPWLGSIYNRVELSGLKLAEAQELAVRVLQRIGLNSQQIKALPQYKDLLDYLGGNALAIQVILPELRRAAPDALLKALQTGELKLSTDDPTQGRERSLAASLTYRLDSLDLTLRRRLGVLGMFQGFVGVGVLDVMCQRIEGAPELIRGLRGQDWMPMLDTAAEVGLLRRVGDSSYIIYPALPCFFHDLLCEAFPHHLDWLERAFFAVYGAYGAQLHDLFKTNAKAAMALLCAEENNLRHAFRLARRYEDWRAVVGILHGLRGLLVTQGRWAEWEMLTANLEAEITDADGKPLAGWEILWRALLEYRSESVGHSRDFDSQKIILLHLKDHYERVGDARNHAIVLYQLGIIAQKRRLFEEAEQWYRQSLAIFERIGDEHSQTTTLHQIGMIARELQQFEEAQRWYEQSLTIQKRTGDERGQAITLHQLGRVAQEHRKFEEAERWYQQSLTIEKRIGDEHSQAITLHELGTIAQEHRKFEEAERWYRQSLAIKERIGDKEGEAMTLYQMGILARELQQFEEAERWYRRSLAIFERIGDERGQAITLHQLGTIAQEHRQFEEAERWYQRSLAIEKRIGDEHSQATTLQELGTFAEKRQQFEEAERWYRQSLVIFERIGDERSQAVTLGDLARIALARRKTAEAVSLLEQAEALFARLNDPQGLDIVRTALLLWRSR